MRNSKVILDQAGYLEPESRADILAEVVRLMTTRMEPVPYGTVLQHVMSELQASEEEVSEFVMRSCLYLLISGLLVSIDFVDNSVEQGFRIREETAVQPSKRLISYCHGDSEGDPDGE